jgi:hypothetical protein
MAWATANDGSFIHSRPQRRRPLHFFAPQWHAITLPVAFSL